MEYKTGIDVIDERLNNYKYNDDDLCVQNRLFNEIVNSATKNKILVIGINTLSQTNNNYYETFLNGWPVNITEIGPFIQELKNTGHIKKTAGFYDLISEFKLKNIRSFFIDPNMSDSISVKKLTDIPEETRYLYPIRIMGRVQFDIDIAREKGVVLPERVVLDARQGFCKILLHDVFEGHGHNLYEIKELLEKISLFYNIPIESIGFLDSNYYTPKLQESYSSKGFFFPYWEGHLARSYFFNLDNQFDKLIEDRLYQQSTNLLCCPYYFINLNRRLRPHRTLITLYNYLNWNEKVLWSYTEPNTVRMNRLWSYLEDDKLKNISGYINSLPKILDTNSDVNDTDINDMQFNAYINLVTETTFFNKDTLFVSEKVYKPILLGQPFIVLGSPGTLSLLKSQGYETFSPYINEEYDNIVDPCARLVAVIKEIDRLCNKSEQEIKQIVTLLHGVCVRNRRKIIARTTEKISINKIIADLDIWVNNFKDTL